MVFSTNISRKKVITENQSKDGIYTGISPSIKYEEQQACLCWEENGFLRINNRLKIKNVQIYAATGQLLFSKTFCAYDVEIPIPQKQKGLLIVRILDENGSSCSRKILHT